MTMILDKVTNGAHPLHVRPGTDDLAMWRDVVERNEYGVDDSIAGMTVLDVGAGIGAFAAKALEHGARQVVCVEPNPDTCQTLRQGMQEQLRSGSVTVIEAAAWSDCGVGKLRLYGGGVRSGDTMVFTPPGEDTVVRKVDFRGLLITFRPEVVKVDCEGSEYEILKDPLPEHVRIAWVEFHGMAIEPWRSKHQHVLNRFRSDWNVNLLKSLPGVHELWKFWR
jgi:FkbM family methyltransferase